MGGKCLVHCMGNQEGSQEAIKVNQASIALSPQDAEAHNNLGTALQGAGEIRRG